MRHGGYCEIVTIRKLKRKDDVKKEYVPQWLFDHLTKNHHEKQVLLSLLSEEVSNNSRQLLQ